MGFQPIAKTAVQYVDLNGDPFSGAVLKAFKAGTTTPILMATDTTGTTTATDAALNAQGYPEITSTQIIPHFDEAYKLSLFPDQAAADSNTGAIWTHDNNALGLTFGQSTVTITSNTILTQATHANSHINVSGATTLTLPAIAGVADNFIFTVLNVGTDVVTIAADGAELINTGNVTANTITLQPGVGATVIAGTTTWSIINNNTAEINQQNTFTKTQTWSKGADIVSASALTLGTDGNYFDVTAANTIDTIGTVGIGTVIKLHFDSTPTLTDGSDLVLNAGGGDIVAEAGDEIELIEFEVGKWRATKYTRSSGESLVAGSFEGKLLHIQDQKTSGTGAGTSTSGSFQTRTLNTVATNEITGASLSSNRITLPAGTYYIQAHAPAFHIKRHKIKLRNITDSSDTLIGTSGFADDFTGGGSDIEIQTRSFIEGRFTLSGTKSVEIQHRTEISQSNNGFGVACIFGVIEIYTDVKIWKIG